MKLKWAFHYHQLFVCIAIYKPSFPLIIDAPQLLMPAGSWTVFLGNVSNRTFM